ncbi:MULTISPECIES: hypothetical protein [unclassified Rhizobium]|uniref:hypothetical protein n=1 Tax=unclassified Rhizobium TaxID=2613769 RepID=UPI0013C51B00|nr:MULTISPECIES: hypothetical protein [unclassified Rhizobium]
MGAFDFNDVHLFGNDERLCFDLALALPLLKFRDGHHYPPRNTSAPIDYLSKVDVPNKGNIASAKQVSTRKEERNYPLLCKYNIVWIASGVRNKQVEHDAVRKPLTLFGTMLQGHADFIKKM